MSSVFLSHNYADKPFVRRLAQDLRAAGVRIWLDEAELMIGDSLIEKIREGIDQMDYLGVILSKHSVQSEWVKREVDIAMNQEIKGKRVKVLPLVIDDCELPWFLEGKFYADFRDLKRYDEEFSKVLRRVLCNAPSLSTEAPFTNSISMEFVLILAGSFMMGSLDSSRQASDHEKPRHRIEISQPFYLGKYPVTQAQWQAVMGDNPSHFKGNSHHPIEMVSWNDAQAFMRELNEKEGVTHYRLPTEAQWEYAVRAGTETPRYSGGVDAITWYAENSNDQTQPVGQKLPNAWGLYDMLGNVWEWVQDRYDGAYYQSSPTVDPGNSDTGTSHVLRGGSWRNGEDSARSARRYWHDPGRSAASIGFRCACSVPNR